MQAFIDLHRRSLPMYVAQDALRGIIDLSIEENSTFFGVFFGLHTRKVSQEDDESQGRAINKRQAT